MRATVLVNKFKLFNLQTQRLKNRYLGQFTLALNKEQIPFDVCSNVSIGKINAIRLADIDNIAMNVVNDADTEIKTLKGVQLSTSMSFVRKMIKVNATLCDKEELSEVVFQALNQYTVLFERNLLDGTNGKHGLITEDNGSIIADNITNYDTLMKSIQKSTALVRESCNLSKQSRVKVYLSGKYWDYYTESITSAINPNTPMIVADLFGFDVEQITSNLSNKRDMIIVLSPDNTTYYYGLEPTVLEEGTTGSSQYLDFAYALLAMSNANVIALNKHIQYKIN